MSPPFDAIVGRLVLMYLTDPAAALEDASTLLRPGGLVCVQELDLGYDPGEPITPLVQTVVGWLRAGFTATGADDRIGLRLHRILKNASLDNVQLTMETALFASDNLPDYSWADVVIAMAPALQKFGIATATQIDAPTLDQRIRDEYLRHEAMMITPPLIGAWATTSPHRRSSSRKASSL